MLAEFLGQWVNTYRSARNELVPIPCLCEMNNLPTIPTLKYQDINNFFPNLYIYNLFDLFKKRKHLDLEDGVFFEFHLQHVGFSLKKENDNFFNNFLNNFSNKNSKFLFQPLRAL